MLISYPGLSERGERGGEGKEEETYQTVREEDTLMHYERVKLTRPKKGRQEDRQGGETHQQKHR